VIQGWNASARMLMEGHEDHKKAKNRQEDVKSVRKKIFIKVIQYGRCITSKQVLKRKKIKISTFLFS
jgi:hypothetical protein